MVGLGEGRSCRFRLVYWTKNRCTGCRTAASTQETIWSGPLCACVFFLFFLPSFFRVQPNKTWTMSEISWTQVASSFQVTSLKYTALVTLFQLAAALWGLHVRCPVGAKVCLCVCDMCVFVLVCFSVSDSGDNTEGAPALCVVWYAYISPQLINTHTHTWGGHTKDCPGTCPLSAPQ